MRHIRKKATPVPADLAPRQVEIAGAQGRVERRAGQRLLAPRLALPETGHAVRMIAGDPGPSRDRRADDGAADEGPAEGHAAAAAAGNPGQAVPVAAGRDGSPDAQRPRRGRARVEEGSLDEGGPRSGRRTVGDVGRGLVRVQQGRHGRRRRRQGLAGARHQGRGRGRSRGLVLVLFAEKQTAPLFLAPPFPRVFIFQRRTEREDRKKGHHIVYDRER